MGPEGLPNTWQLWIKSEIPDFTEFIRIYKFSFSLPLQQSATYPLYNNVQLFSTYVADTLHTFFLILPTTLQVVELSHYTDLGTEAQSVWITWPRSHERLLRVWRKKKIPIIFPLTGSPYETNTLGRHFENICVTWLVSDAEWIRGPDSIPYSDITNSMISAPASSKVKFSGFEKEWLHRLISRTTYISKSLHFYVLVEV